MVFLKSNPTILRKKYT